MTTCIRRSYSTWTSCPCPPCTADRNRMGKLARNGKISRVPSSAAWEKIDALTDAGWSPSAIASAAGLNPRYVMDLLETDRRGKRPRIGPARAAALVAISGTPTKGLVPVIGARRRLQALGILGHSITALSERSGIHHTTLHVIKSGHTREIHAHQNAAVKGLYDELSDTQGDSGVTATLAKKRRYSPPDAWTAETIDDPAAKPLNLIQRRARQAAEMIEDVGYLARGGCTLEATASRLGMKPSALEKALRRHDRHDLIATMRRNDPGYIDPARRLTYEEGLRIINHVSGASGYGPDMGRGRKAA